LVVLVVPLVVVAGLVAHLFYVDGPTIHAFDLVARDWTPSYDATTHARHSTLDLDGDLVETLFYAERCGSGGRLPGAGAMGPGHASDGVGGQREQGHATDAEE